jgi:DegV family protein with EDD domain
MLNYESHYEHFLKMARAGVKETLHFTISSGLSPTVAVANKAAADVKEKYPDFTVYAVDSLTATVGQGVLVQLAVERRNEGWSAKRTYEYVMSLRQRIQHCIIPDDLQYLKKGGRVSSVSAAVGTVLNIKPILSFDADGKLKVVEKRKGMKKSFQKVLETIAIAPLDELRKIVVVHTDNEEGANELAKLVEEKTGVKPWVSIMGPVIGSHVGPGSVSCGWISIKTREEILR